MNEVSQKPFKRSNQFDYCRPCFERVQTVQNVQMVLCRVLAGDKRYCAYVLIYDKFEPFERFEPLLGPFERFERYMSTSLNRMHVIMV